MERSHSFWATQRCHGTVTRSVTAALIQAQKLVAGEGFAQIHVGPEVDGLPAELDRAEDVRFEVVDKQGFLGVDSAEGGERGEVNGAVGFHGLDLVRVD